MRTFGWIRTWQLGVKSVLLHPLRSLLTVLGIFVGVASVIWLLAIGEGISMKAQEQIASLGADNIIIRSVKPPSDQTTNVSGPLVYGLTRRDFDRIAGSIPTIRKALPIRETRQRFQYGPRRFEGRLVGCTPDYAELTQLFVDRGRFITEAEVTNMENACVLAAGTAEKLFPFEDPIGREVRVEEQYFVVVGVMKPRASSAGVGGSMAPQDFQFDIYVPISTLLVRIGDFFVQGGAGTFSFEIVELTQITLRVDHVDHVLDTADLVRDMLQRHHKEWDDYTVVVPLDLLEQAKTTKLLFMVFMGLIAAVSLLVGGIGIMNIMLATVTERTREIGIRRAIGAKRGDIIRQFLVETVVLSVSGGVVGILGGLTCEPVLIALREIANWAKPELMRNLPDIIREVEPILVPLSIPGAFLISVLIGVLFGLYPAYRAASMDPVEALRHE
jgi:putative ABC transport system permease protein